MSSCLITDIKKRFYGYAASQIRLLCNCGWFYWCSFNILQFYRLCETLETFAVSIQFFLKNLIEFFILLKQLIFLADFLK